MTLRRFLLILPVFVGLLFCCGVNVPAQATPAGGPIRVACVGDSITAGVGATPGDNCYPMQLQRMLGSGYQVGNFGNSGKTLMKSGDYPYQATDTCRAALASQPNIVTIMLGTNDTKPWNWKNKDKFIDDYKNLIFQFQTLASHPKIYIVRPPYISGNGNYGINEPAMKEELGMIDSIAKDTNLPEIDVQGATMGKDSDFPDHVHPNNDGYFVLAKTIYQGITGKEFTGKPDSIILQK